MTDNLEVEAKEKREKAINFFKKANWIYYILLAGIAWFGYWIRTRNLSILKDITTGQYIPADPDAMLFLRYAEYILAHGKIMAVDTLRYFPIGYNTSGENVLLAYVITYLYKFIALFKSVTLQYVDVIYPAIAFVLIIIFFYLFVKEISNHKVALIASAFLTVIPTFLFRTVAGVSDKEAFAFVLLFAALYFFALSWKNGSVVKHLIFSGISGILVGVMSMTWGGTSYVFITVGVFLLVELFLNKIETMDVIAYGLWTAMIMMMIGFIGLGNFTVPTMFTSLTSGAILTFPLMICIFKVIIFDKNLFRIKDKLKDLPEGVMSLIIGTILILIAASIILGPSFVVAKANELYVGMTQPFGQTRWALTVAENHQPYITEWLGQLGWQFVLIFMIGSVLLFHEMLRVLKLTRGQLYGITAAYTIFLFGFVFSRYSSSSILNGTSNLAMLLYIGLFIAFILFIAYIYFKAFFKNKEVYERIKDIDKKYTFIFILFILTLIGARSAARLMFVFSPLLAFMAAYFFFIIYEEAKKIAKVYYRYIVYVILLLILLSPITLGFINQGILVGYSKAVIGTSPYVGPILDRQWQLAMNWTRSNTPEDAVFSHWWDYGYLVQYAGQRATISDGGNSRGAINFFTGRYLLTGQSDTEALQLLKANNVSYFLAVADDIGKYPAYSVIGSDTNYDRYSWINVFNLDTANSRETRTGQDIVYTGGTPLDEDFIYNGKLLPAGSSGIAGFIVPITNITENGTAPQIQQPIAVAVLNGQRVDIPLKCLYLEKKIEWQGNGLDGCLRIIPSFDGTTVNPMGSALYLSPRVKRTIFARYYLFNEQDEYFKVVYDDSNDGAPLATYNGRLIGPLKIWKISYPSNLTIPKEYYGQELPDPRVDISR